MKFFFFFLLWHIGGAIAFAIWIGLMLSSCESATQTAIRENQPPAIAFVVAASKGEPLPTAVIIREE